MRLDGCKLRDEQHSGSMVNEQILNLNPLTTRLGSVVIKEHEDHVKGMKKGKSKVKS